MSDQIQKIFFSKDIISNLNKLLNQEINPNNDINLTRELKQQLIDLLIKNMKSIFKSMDTSKISSSNLDSILDQFKNFSINETVKEIKSLNLLNVHKQTTDIKFQRDFNSLPTSGNIMIDRPKSTKNTFLNSNENLFNNFSSKNDLNVIEKFNEIDKTRTIKEDKSMSLINQNDFKNMNSNDFNKSFNGLANDLGENLFSIDNIDKQITNIDYVEDSSNFEERLNKLQFERNTTKQVITNTSIDFTSDKFPQSIYDGNVFNTNNNLDLEQNTKKNNYNLNNYEKQQQPPQKQQEQSFSLQEQENQIKQQKELQIKQHQLLLQQEQELQLKQQQELQIKKQQLFMQQQEQMKQQQLLIQQQEQIKLNKMKNIYNDSDNIQEIKNYKQIDQIDQLESMVKQIINKDVQKSNLQVTNNLENNQNIINMIIDLKNENSDLKNKLEINAINKIDIDLKTNEFLVKENQINNIINKYDYIFKSKYIQLEISSEKNESVYSWYFKNLLNVNSIKLLYYSLPFNNYNIEENLYNILKIKNKNSSIIHEISIKTGNYNINTLLTFINLKFNELNIKLNIYVDDIEQKIIIDSIKSDDSKESNESNESNEINESNESNESNEFLIIPTDFSNKILGFDNNNEFKNKKIANRIYDLRLNNKIYLYLENISSSQPFGIFHKQNNLSNNLEQSNAFFKFTEQFSLDKLDLAFRNNKGDYYNFYNLPHELIFLLELS